MIEQKKEVKEGGTAKNNPPQTAALWGVFV